jgi:hypothetical protein
VHPDGTDLVAECALSAERILPGSDSPQWTVHFTGSVRFAEQADEPESEPLPEDGGGIGPAEVYRLYFHGPAYQVVGSAWGTGEGAAGRFASGLPAAFDPVAGPVISGPRLTELFFQTAGLWEAGRYGRLALPLHVGRVRLLAEPAEREGIVAVVRPDGDGFAGSVLDPTGQVLLRIEDYRTIPLPNPVPDDVRVPIQSTMDS